MVLSGFEGVLVFRDSDKGKENKTLISIHCFDNCYLTFSLYYGITITHIERLGYLWRNQMRRAKLSDFIMGKNQEKIIQVGISCSHYLDLCLSTTGRRTRVFASFANK